jgi:hypothetical protein
MTRNNSASIFNEAEGERDRELAEVSSRYILIAPNGVRLCYGVLPSIIHASRSVFCMIFGRNPQARSKVEGERLQTG